MDRQYNTYVFRWLTLLHSLWQGFVYLTVLSIVAGVAWGQPDSLWSRTFGGTSEDVACSMQQTSDGGYVLAGWTNCFWAGGKDMCLVKTDASGSQQWGRTFGGSFDDVARCVRQTSDGGYVLAGTTRYERYLVKTDANGNQQWARTFGDGRLEYRACSVQQTNDGGYVLAGARGAYAVPDEIYLLKTDADGNQQWARSYGDSLGTWASSVQQTSDGGYALAGSIGTEGRYTSDMYLVKTDGNGNEQWARTFGSGDSTYVAYDMQQTSDGGYVLAGSRTLYGSLSDLTYADVYVVKTDVNGFEQWTCTWHNDSSIIDEASAVRQTCDGGFVLAGHTASFAIPDYDMYLVKVDANGQRQWARTFGGRGGDEAASVLQTSDGGFVLAGYTGSFGAGASDMWLVKTGRDPMLSAPSHLSPFPLALSLSNYPNPFNPSTWITLDVPKAGNVSLKVFDVLGQEVATVNDGRMSAGNHRLLFDGTGLASGTYVIRLEANGGVLTKKMTLIK